MVRDVFSQNAKQVYPIFSIENYRVVIAVSLYVGRVDRPVSHLTLRFKALTQVLTHQYFMVDAIKMRTVNC